jgi:hypothetical protein
VPAMQAMQVTLRRRSPAPRAQLVDQILISLLQAIRHARNVQQAALTVVGHRRVIAK